MNLIDYLRSAFTGTPRARDEHRKALALNPGIASGVAELERQCGDAAPDDSDAPIFLLSAGWRSGSTLLQRLIMSDPRVIIWGEPYDECGIIQALAETVTAFRVGWPPPEYYYDGAKPGEMTFDWIANLFPRPPALKRGYRAFFDASLAEPARAAGASRWGVKEVRLGAEHARFLRWLYPDARFVFLVRNPLDAYRSYCRYGRNWYDTWPARPVFTPASFGTHWRKLTAGYLRDAVALDALVVRYEDLIKGGGDLLQRIERHLDVRVDPAVMGRKVGTSERDGEHVWISRLEKALLRRAVSPVAHDTGYDW